MNKISHTYAIGAEVTFSPGQIDTKLTHGVYTIVRHLPTETGRIQYRIKHSDGKQERIANESEIIPLQ